jgi:hypothetical protein
MADITRRERGWRLAWGNAVAEMMRVAPSLQGVLRNFLHPYLSRNSAKANLVLTIS